MVAESGKAPREEKPGRDSPGGKVWERYSKGTKGILGKQPEKGDREELDGIGNRETQLERHPEGDLRERELAERWT